MSTPLDDSSDPDGFDEFFRLEYPKLLALGRALAPSAAGDLAQEAMIRSCRHWSTVSEMDIPGAWVRRVMLNLVADHHRARRRRDRMVDRFGSQLAAGWDEVAGVELDDEAWFAAVRSLPRRQRDVVALHYIDQIPIAEVAVVLDIAAGTVKSSLARARRTLVRQFPRTEDAR